METQREIVKLRNHFTYIFEEIWGVILLLTAILFSSNETFAMAIDLISKGNIIQGLLTMGGIVVVFLVIIAWYINRWYRTYITVKDGTFTMERHTLNRRVNAIAVQNISNINLEQNLFEMVMGTYKLKLDTNSMSTADKTDIQIVLRKKEAYAVKNLVMSMMKEIQQAKALEEGREMEEEQKLPEETSAASDLMEDTEEIKYDIIYPMKDIIINCMVNTSIILLLASIGMFIAAVIGAVEMAKTGKGIAVIVSSMLIQIVLVGSIISTLVNNWLNDFNFRVKRDKDKIYVSSGSIKRRKYAVPVDKINAVCLTSTFLGRIFKYAYVKVINVGGEGEDVDGMKLLLSGRYDTLKKNMEVLLPEFAFPELSELKRQPKCVLVKKLIYGFLFCAIVVLGIMIGISLLADGTVTDKEKWIILICGAAFYGILIMGYVLSYYAAALSVREEYLIISRGMFIRTIEFIPYDKIQNIHFQCGPVERFMGLQRGYVSILANTVSRVQGFGLFKKENFDVLEDKFRETY